MNDLNGANKVSTVDSDQMSIELRESGALAILKDGSNEVILQDDFIEITASIQGNVQVPAESDSFENRSLFESRECNIVHSQQIQLVDGSCIAPPSTTNVETIPPGLGPIVRALTNAAQDNPSKEMTEISETALPGRWTLSGPTTSLHTLAKKLVQSNDDWALLADRDFANSAPYMGAKRVLLPFIMTAIETLTSAPSVAVDLMCGSGVVSGALARNWPTISSDSQSFCRSLAVVQGGGFTRKMAAATLQKMTHPMSQNSTELSNLVSELMAEEAEMFYSATDLPTLAKRYSDFVDRTPGYPIGGQIGAWNPVQEIEHRQSNDSRADVYCLTTAYFANVYFGVRQAVELDSIRFAIDQLKDGLEREWALGALAVTASSIATTYGGHFAQPPAPPSRLMLPNYAKRVLAQRHISATREFEIRFLALATESEKIANPVKSIDGPWETALSTISQTADPQTTLVYLDAPYRREEYSRYYHVLETIVKYTYPSADGSARIGKKGDDRFSSEFFTRNHASMTRALSRTIGSILDSGFRCAWSYADKADANALEVLDGIAGSISRVRSVSSDHTFKSQGGSLKSGRVREFLFLIEP